LQVTNPATTDSRWPLLALVGAGVVFGLWYATSSGASRTGPGPIAGATNTGGGSGGGTVPFNAASWSTVPATEASTSATVGDQVTLSDTAGLSYQGTVTAVNYTTPMTYNVLISSAPGPSAAGGGGVVQGGQTVTGVPIQYIDDYGQEIT